jgi:hypothetical protein
VVSPEGYPDLSRNTRFEVLTAVLLKIQICWNIKQKTGIFSPVTKFYDPACTECNQRSNSKHTVAGGGGRVEHPLRATKSNGRQIWRQNKYFQ